ncbi:MAG: hypothetical protein P1U49_08885 [Minwuia sp.]|nr:hypothetical protein [Minwuia sp.]
MTEASTGFDLIAVVDWSAAASPGPARPTKDRVWLAWGTVDERPSPVYCRTRNDCLDHLEELVRRTGGNALIAWDFPFGYPAESGLGGGRDMATRLAQLIEDGPRDRNNRFAVANDLNRALGSGCGPFWARPARLAAETVPEKKPDFTRFPFPEWRIVERHTRQLGFSSIQSVWKLYTIGSVGSQALMGLAAIQRLNDRLADHVTARWWPFDTGWSARLDGLVHVECWPSLFDISAAPWPIRDQAQVAVTRDAIMAWQRDGMLASRLSAPDWLTGSDLDKVSRSEGWILGLPDP